ncbi:hypothetical protein ACFQL1_16085 [Halomicroarcula sp. GCM10025709]|uniref:hypothetical protein n=1 Tax=Halomicroarcula sp. GCM10025709 TaxID=3252669 RepID=UPI00362122E8
MAPDPLRREPCCDACRDRGLVERPLATDATPDRVDALVGLLERVADAMLVVVGIGRVVALVDVVAG